MTVWRLIPPICASGALQMALDAWLFEQHVQHGHPPTLRFYTWHPIAISLGYHQRQCPEHWHTLTWDNQPVSLVRRPTGGRAVLHQGDLTYAVITSGVASNRQQAYRQICEFLIQGWRSLGVELSYGVAGRGYIHNPNCFGSATAADLILPDGTKLIGSAQLRRGDAILQHGSMRIQPNAELFHRVFNPHLSEPRSHALDVAPLLAMDFSLDTAGLEALMQPLISAAQQCFQAEFCVSPLSPGEWADISSQIAAFEVMPPIANP